MVNDDSRGIVGMLEWKFKRDTAFRKQFFVPESFSHPAKMDAQLLIKIVETYTVAGEVILDPMAGSGTTMLACTLGRHCILVELEEKFCKMMRDNWEEVRMRPQLGSAMGECQIIQGDARQLEGLVDKIVTSPPFSESKAFHDLEFMDKTSKDQSERVDDGEIKGHSFTPEARRRVFEKAKQGEIENPDNIGNLPYGEIDKCIFSPPYALSDARNPSEGVQKQKSWKAWDIGQSDNKDNISNLPYGQIASIITSPPYENEVGAQDKEFMKQHLKIIKRNPEGYGQQGHQGGYKNDNNIGNLKSQSYLEAMLQVYQECYKVLKPQGLMILVTKNFIRNKQVIRLDEDTIKLCEQAGFKFLERHYRKLPAQSFWRVIYHKKHPEVEQILNEDILVFVKLGV